MTSQEDILHSLYINGLQPECLPFVYLYLKRLGQKEKILDQDTFGLVFF
ncbi:hypothetical protein SAMN02787081_04318 [Lysinibacillus fusiformis]|uniref:Uncharacterized protein n=1 Tax=Lysinibacillus fusiformis TaxID=28031 RepID=A0A1H9QN11_9BACI|nr:hypothetical protein SAMN02787081_04318 [Lysinibacillus fusiformis]SEO38438.1 hypothetical protein SAMN02787103_04276 [Lysinibacillus fusiformis]SER61133.1 hypothetical protein SAMN02787113_04200 [Lysinibacillus fusiformis]